MSNRDGDGGEARRARDRGRAGGRRWRGEVRRAAPRARQAAAARADRAARRRGVGVPGAVAAGGLGLGLPRRCLAGHGHRGGRGRRVPDHRERPDGQGRGQQPVDREEGLPGRADRRGEPPPDDLARRVRRGGPADPEGDLHPRRQAVPRPHARQCPAAADHRAGVRQLDRRRRVRAGHERLHGHGQGAGEGVPRRPAAGEDGDRRGVRRRVPRRRRDARPGLRPRRLPRPGRARRHPDRPSDRGAAELAQALAVRRPAAGGPNPTATPTGSST